MAKKVVTDEQTQLEVIELFEEKIRRIELQKEKYMPEFTEKLKFMQHVQQEFADIELKMKNFDDEIAIAMRRINHFKGNDSKNIIGIVGEKKQMAWLPYINEIIKKENRFLIFDEIWKLLGENPEIIEQTNKLVAGFKGQKMAVKTSLENHAANLTSIRTRYVNGYQDKFGLPEWVNHKGHLTTPGRAVEFIGIEQAPAVIPISTPIVTPRIKKSRAK